MTVAEALRAAAARLAETSDAARLDAELLMAEALGTGRSEMLLRHTRDDAPGGFDALVERRAAHEPVAHILGRQEFYGREFRVTPDTLIPRGDSEVLVEAALELKHGAKRVLDMGTGTGALVISVLLETDAAGVATDRSRAALAIAAENAAIHAIGERVQFVEADWNLSDWAAELGRFDLILCNPPYVEDGAMLDPDVGDHEPAGALFAGPDGLDAYRAIVPQLGKLLLPGGITVLEIGANQASAVARIARAEGFACAIRQDLAGRDRCAVLS